MQPDFNPQGLYVVRGGDVLIQYDFHIVKTAFRLVVVLVDVKRGV